MTLPAHLLQKLNAIQSFEYTSKEISSTYERNTTCIIFRVLLREFELARYSVPLAADESPEEAARRVRWAAEEV